MRQLTLAERAATTTAMSAEQVAMCDDVAKSGDQQGRIIRNLCASHEALRLVLASERCKFSAKMDLLLNLAERLEASKAYRISEELLSILRS